MSASYLAMLAIAVAVIIGCGIREIVRGKDEETTLSELFDGCTRLAAVAFERAQAAEQGTLVNVYAPDKIANGSWGCRTAQIWWTSGGRYMVGYYVDDPSHAPRIYRRSEAGLPPDSPLSHSYEIRSVTSVWQKSEIERVEQSLQEIIGQGSQVMQRKTAA